MTISELIEELEKIKEKHGDIDVEYQYNDDGYMLSGSSDISGVYVETRDWKPKNGDPVMYVVIA